MGWPRYPQSPSHCRPPLRCFQSCPQLHSHRLLLLPSRSLLFNQTFPTSILSAPLARHHSAIPSAMMPAPTLILLAMAVTLPLAQPRPPVPARAVPAFLVMPPRLTM